jgi:predicted nuclease of predicted toxin-antitoxin system
VLILLDNNVPRGLARALAGHAVTETRERGWATLKNGDLLTAAEQAGFEVLVTSDKSIKYQQNLAGRKIAIVALGKGRWTLIKPHLAKVVAAVNAAAPASFSEVEIPE